MQEFEIEFEIKPSEFEIDISNVIRELTPPLIDLEVDPTSEKQIFKHDGEYGYDEVIVNPISSEYIKPTGTLDITANGEYDVKSYEKAKVELPSGASEYFYESTSSNTVRTLLKKIPMFAITGTSMHAFFEGCSSLTTIPQLDTSNVTAMNYTFNNCSKLTTLGGFQNLGQAYSTTQSANYSNYTLKLSSSTLLTHDSLMNVINNLYDIATKGCNTQKLVLGSTNLAKLTAEEIAIATNKGWSVS